MLASKIKGFIGITRLDKPIGIYLLLWPALIALVVSTEVSLNYSFVFIIVIGAILVRSVGCVINDIFDMNFDKKVDRTKHRPLASGQLSRSEAFVIFVLLSFICLLLVFNLDKQTQLVCLFFAAFIIIYPLTKRFLKIPQIFLGITFGSSIPIVFSMNGKLFDSSMWVLYFANFFWIVAYDSFYAMNDFDDDKELGINSSVTYWTEESKKFITIFQTLSCICLLILGYLNNFSLVWYIAIAISVLLFRFQHEVSKKDEHLRAFKNNNYVGLLFLFALLIEKYSFFI